MQRNKRGQAALEFLLTYSWAILVVIVIIGALAYFGVLNPENFIPERCQLGAGIVCDDYAYDASGINGTANPGFLIRLQNGLGRSITIQNVAVYGTDLLGQDATTACTFTGPVTVANGDTVDVQLSDPDCAAQEGFNTMRATVQIDYTNTGGLNAPKTNTGELFIKNI